ncbi:hypothetical protein DFP93_103121 [Aneurinibacillus soli]|uniref:Uncharacterized protein n=1 Tax=Aneurinibacillus soli TaxID=1500254 RepID=A0A0U5BFH7_9BACL|nr:hypothetical protein [Aneurinibacillus soli]PYE62911.1 hypothetical protein DFP93_103121 [Aneurinibacillus soli]BAU29031.1 hypothetical protein CB4_03209 [Aneurinibacillus soli]
MQKIIRVLPVCFFIFLFFQIDVYAKEEPLSSFSLDVTNDRKTDYTISLLGWPQTVPPVIHTVNYPHASYTYYRYQSNKRTFELVLARINNGDVLYFAKQDPTTRRATVSVQIQASDTSTVSASILREKKWERIKLPASASTPFYVQGSSLAYRIGSVTSCTPLGYSTFAEKRAKRPSVAIEKSAQSITYTVPLPAEKNISASTWGILAGQPLLAFENKDAARAAAAIEFDTIRKLDVDGSYSRTPDATYEPYTSTSFYLNPANLEGLQAVQYLDKSYGSLFYDIATHLAYSAIRNQNEYGYWPTQPRSSGWLYEDYKIGFAYMDNRRNADNATFLLRYAHFTKDDAVWACLQKWDHYHTWYMNTYSLKTGKEGWLIPDYVDEQGHLSHTSLNHQVANLNYLLESYVYTQNSAKKQQAITLLRGIEDTKARWVMPNHNLYYALSQNLHPLPQRDYLELTRNDLLLSQYLLNRATGTKSTDIQWLITEKNKWLATR